MNRLGLVGPITSAAKQSQQCKEVPLVPELIASVDQFKTFLAQQKAIREELVNLSQQPLFKLKDDLSAVMHQFSAVVSALRRIAVQRDHLKEDVLKEEKYLGMAQRITESGLTTQLDNNLNNSATVEYFTTKMTEFDSRMHSYKQELEILEHHVSAQSQQPHLSSQELIALLRKMDEEFICLAAQLHTSWEQVKALKSTYLRSRCKLGLDGRNPFEDIETSSIKLRHLEGSIDNSLLKFTKGATLRPTPYGPSPFSSSSSAGTSLTLGGVVPITSQTIAPTGISAVAAPTSLSLSTNLFGQATGTTPSTAGTLLPKFSFGSGLNPVAPTSSNTAGTLGLGTSQVNAVKPFSFGFNSTTTSTTSTTGSLFGKRFASKS